MVIVAFIVGCFGVLLQIGAVGNGDTNGAMTAADYIAAAVGLVLSLGSAFALGKIMDND